jgi:4-amino-4-deoxy-L-arabinose transferase-like glycosyltransferase
VYLLILSISIVLRIANLGYSDFQGDEISAQNYLFGEQNFINFLFTRTKGPGQYIVTFITNLFFKNSAYNYFFLRVPFALAGILTLILVHRWLKKVYGKRCANYATFFLGFSGLLIAFSRIVQYQSFVILFSVFAVTNLRKFEEENPLKYLKLSSFFSAIALLFHYDALSFIIPICLFLLIKKQYIDFATYVELMGIILSLFYIPFMFTSNFSETLNYLLKSRIGGRFEFDSLFYSTKIFDIYHSKEYGFLLLFSCLLWLFNFQKTLALGLKIIFVISFYLVVNRVLYESFVSVLVCLSVLFSCSFLFIYIYNLWKQKEHSFHTLITLWFFVSFTAYGITFKKPLTHIYTFLTPLFILISVYLSKIKQKVILNGIFVIAGISSISFNYKAFIETTKEYPWTKKNYIFGKMPENLANGEHVMGIFGFTYNREWRAIEKDMNELRSTENVTTYSTNEKYRISKYYLQGFKYVEREKCQVFIHVKNPQSFDPTPPPKFYPLRQKEKYTIYEAKNL